MAAAAGYLEPVDVEDAVYGVAFDPTGRRYRIGVEAGKVVFSPDERPPDPEALKTLVIEFLRSIGTFTVVTDDLASLLKQCEPFVSA